MKYTSKAKRYAKEITTGIIPSSKYVKQACDKFLLEADKKDWDWYYSEKHAEHVCAFMENGIKHFKGPLKDQLIKLEDWQCFVLCNIYGFINKEGIRKHQYCILEVARKNGKTLFASGLAIYDMIFNKEGGEVYSLATARDQAKIAWDGAVDMINSSVPEVKDQFKIVTNKISNFSKKSSYCPLSREAQKFDGKNPSLCIFDEAAAYGDRNLVEVMTSATGARDNFMHLFITTAQFSRTTVYYENRNYAIDVLAGRVDDDRWFSAIYCLESDEDWTDEEIWIKANPNLNVSLKKDFLQNEVNQAQAMQSKKNGVLVKHFNIFTNAEETWINVEEWQANKDTIIKDGDLYLAVDLSSTRDLTAICYLWNNGDKFSVDFQCFLPRRAIENVPVHIKAIYQKAIEDGLLKLTLGDVVDYKVVKEYIQDAASKYNLKMIGYDKWNAAILVNELEDAKLPVMEIGQSMSALSAASKETERMIVEKLFRQEGNSFIDWQFECCSIYTDKNDNIKITKDETDKSLKIDAVVSLIMAVSMAAGNLEPAKEFNFSHINF